MFELPLAHSGLRKELRIAADVVLEHLRALEDVKCLLWGGSSADARLNEDGDVDLWAIVNKPAVSLERFVARMHDQVMVTHVHRAGYVPWFGQLVSVFFGADCSFSIDVGFAAPHELEQLNVGPGYWIMYCEPALRPQVLKDIRPRSYAQSTQKCASDLIVDAAKIRKSLHRGEMWNAVEYLARARRTLMWVLRRNKPGVVRYYSRPERDFDRYLTLSEQRILESTVAGPEASAIARAAGNVVRHFLSLTGSTISADIRDRLLTIAHRLTGLRQSHPDVGVIGVGRIGGRLVRHLLANGHRVSVADLDATNTMRAQRAGATVTSLRELWDRCEIVLLSLPGPDAVDEVIGTLLRPAPPTRLLVDLSTNAPDRVARVASAARTNGHSFVDAPISGGIWGADAGSLVVMAGGTAEDVSRALPILLCFAREVVHVGPSGHGCVAKLLHNLVGEIQVHAFAEAFAVGSRLGIDLNALYRCLAGGMASSRILTELFASSLMNPLGVPNVPLAAAARDQQLLLDLAARAGINLTFTLGIIERQTELLECGLGDFDVTATLRWFEDHHRCQVRIQPVLHPSQRGGI